MGDKDEKSRSDTNEKENYLKHTYSSPVTPKMLIKALKQLKRKTFKGLLFTPKEVAVEIILKYPGVEQDFECLLMEVSDKLLCAAAAGLIGSKQDSAYYAFDIRQEGLRADSKSELMFWVFYKKLLNRKKEEELLRRRKDSSNNKDNEAK